MYAEYRIPRARDWAVPFAAAVVLMVSSVTQPTANLWAQVAFGLACVAGLWGGINLYVHLADANSGLKERERDWSWRRSDNYRAELIARMTPEQLKAWLRGAKVTVDIQPGAHGPVEYVRGEEFYLYTVWFILTNSTGYKVYPINNFSQGTYKFDVWGDHAIDDYTQAHAVTAFFVRYGWAEWGRGNQSATWTEGHDPDTVLGYFGLDRESYN